MIFAFLRKKFQRARIVRIFALQRRKHAVIGELAGKQRGFPGEILAGVRVRAGYHAQMIQVAPAAIHVRIGRKPCFRRENMRCQVFKAFMQGIKA